MNRIEVVGEICQINLDNEAQNYLTSPEFISPSELSEIINNRKCKAILVKGTGRHFSAGADKENLFKMAMENILDAEISKGHSLFQLIRSFYLPIIACIEGACFGGGLEIALLADVKFASKKAMFAFPESNIGLMPGLGGIFETARITGKANTLDVVLRGDVVSADEALDLNLIDYLVDERTTYEHGIRMAKRLVQSRDMEVIKAVVESVRNSSSLEYEEAMERETELFCKLARLAVNKK
jgi:enoyl-CoA hydratase/carnithine racemase